MSDPRNVAHAKKVLQAKKHNGEDPAKGTTVETVQPGKKPHMQHPQEHEDPATERAEAAEQKIEEVVETVKHHQETVDPHQHS